jgi:hypothetical protein
MRGPRLLPALLFLACVAWTLAEDVCEGPVVSKRCDKSIQALHICTLPRWVQERRKRRARCRGVLRAMHLGAKPPRSKPPLNAALHPTPPPPKGRAPARGAGRQPGRDAVRRRRRLWIHPRRQRLAPRPPRRRRPPRRVRPAAAAAGGRRRHHAARQLQLCGQVPRGSGGRRQRDADVQRPAGCVLFWGGSGVVSAFAALWMAAVGLL